MEMICLSMLQRQVLLTVVWICANPNLKTQCANPHLKNPTFSYRPLQSESKNPAVLKYPTGACGLGDYPKTMLQAPSDKNLCGCSAVFLGYPFNGWMIEPPSLVNGL